MTLPTCNTNNSFTCLLQHNVDLIDDDINDDIRCVKKIFREHKRLSGNGLNAW